MALVDYSDSEESGDEHTKPQPPPPTTSSAPPAKRSKSSGFQRADTSDTGRINLELPTEAQVAANTDGPPQKRARTGLFGAMPSKQNKPKPSSTASRVAGHGNGLGRGVNLKTGAEPAFSRSAPSPFTSAVSADSTQPAAQEALRTELPRPSGRSTMFKPLSVSRRPQNQLNQSPSAFSSPSETTDQIRAQKAPASNKASRKPKVALFSNATEPTRDDESKTAGYYNPFLEPEASAPACAPDQQQYGGLAQQSDETHLQPTHVAQGSDLKALATQLNLSAGERRQLIGRDGKPDAIKIQQFNVAREYQLNNELRESNAAAPQQNAVRSIAPGKHSLQQLVNAATSQRDALEDAFAQGRRNKADAGSRYGWS